LTIQDGQPVIPQSSTGVNSQPSANSGEDSNASSEGLSSGIIAVIIIVIALGSGGYFFFFKKTKKALELEELKYAAAEEP
jgi:flagellar basal body-associated protein FliL